MPKYLLLPLCAILAACGKSDATRDEAASAVAPKPVFKVKYIDQSVINGLALGAPAEGQTADGKKRVVYPIEGLGGDNRVELIGERSNDLESLQGRCMETDAAGRNTGWAKEGGCHALLSELVGNIAEDGTVLTDYLVGHAGLIPYSEEKSGYAAVQNGRYILEIDSGGAFYFRRRHY